jgi:hypothetical protein
MTRWNVAPLMRRVGPILDLDPRHGLWLRLAIRMEYRRLAV